MKYKQLSLDGDRNDHYRTEKELTNFNVLTKAISSFYNANSEYNPRQLHYLICQESNDIQLGALLEI